MDDDWIPRMKCYSDDGELDCLVCCWVFVAECETMWQIHQIRGASVIPPLTMLSIPIVRNLWCWDDLYPGSALRTLYAPRSTREKLFHLVSNSLRGRLIPGNSPRILGQFHSFMRLYYISILRAGHRIVITPLTGIHTNVHCGFPSWVRDGLPLPILKLNHGT